MFRISRRRNTDRVIVELPQILILIFNSISKNCVQPPTLSNAAGFGAGIFKKTSSAASLTCNVSWAGHGRMSCRMVWGPGAWPLGKDPLRTAAHKDPPKLSLLEGVQLRSMFSHAPYCKDIFNCA